MKLNDSARNKLAFSAIDIVMMMRKWKNALKYAITYNLWYSRYQKCSIKQIEGWKPQGRTTATLEWSSDGIRAQLKCHASATQQQPPINKCDYRCTTNRISVQEDCSITSQPVRKVVVARASSAEFSPLALSPLVPCPSLLFLILLPLFRLSLSYSFSVSHAYTRTYTNIYIYARARAQWTDILPSASGAHNKKVETFSSCGHVPHPPLVSPAPPSAFLLAILTAEKARNV